MADPKDRDVHPPNEAGERRGESRAAITLKVDYKRLNTFFADYTRNISKGGTFIRTNKPLELGTEFVFVLTVPEPNSEESAPHDSTPNEGGRGVRLELTGEVKWVVSESTATEEKPAGMGIQFIFKSNEERERIDRIVADLMRLSLGARLTEKLLARS